MPLVVKYHQTRMTHFSLGIPNGETGENFEAAEKFWVKPGTNVITDPAKAALLLANKEFQASVEATKKAKAVGKIPMGCEIIECPENWKVAPKAASGDKPAEDGVLGRNPWAKTSEELMAQVIAECNDIVQLDGMKKVEDRASVLAMITERMATIRKGAPDADEDEEPGDLD